MTSSDYENRLDTYAELVVKIGLNLQSGQRLMINTQPAAAPLVHRIAAHAYQAGARLVDTIWSDPQLLLTRFAHAPRDSFDEVAEWWVKAGLEYAEAGDATLSIRAIDPDLLAGQDPALIATMQQAQAAAFAPVSRLGSAHAMNWCVVAYPAPEWAAKVFPDAPSDEQIELLGEAIFAACRVDAADPVAAWQDHMAQLQAKSDLLNAKQYDALHYRGPGTDLTVGLPAGHRWEGGSSTNLNGIVNAPNMPTEEVFTAPHRERAEGTVRATMPLSHGGSVVEGFSLTFKDGQVVDLSAEKGEDLLRSIVETDEGARRLGEVALVPHSSPISQSGILFYNTLFDENAASHIALGRAYRTSFNDATELSDEEFAALGGNTSLKHVDFMIGSGELDIDGLNANGTAEPLMRAGEWVEN